MQAERSHRNGLGACLAQVCTDRWPARHTFLAGLGAGRPRSRRPLASGGSFLPACRGRGLAMSPPCPGLSSVCRSPSHRDTGPIGSAPASTLIRSVSPQCSPCLPRQSRGGLGLPRVDLRDGQLRPQQAVRRCSVSPGCWEGARIPAPFDLSRGPGVTEWHLLCGLPRSVRRVMKWGAASEKRLDNQRLEPRAPPDSSTSGDPHWVERAGGSAEPKPRLTSAVAWRGRATGHPAERARFQA